MGGAVRLHLHFQIVGHGEKDGETGDDAHVLLHQGEQVSAGPQKEGHPLQIQQHRRRQNQGDYDDHEQVLVKIVAGFFLVPLPQGQGQDGGGAGGQQDADGEHQGDKGHGQIDRAQGMAAHPVGHENAVYHGVQGEDPHGDDGRDGKLEKFAY